MDMTGHGQPCEKALKTSTKRTCAVVMDKPVMMEMDQTGWTWVLIAGQ